MSLVQYDDVIQAVPSDASDHSFHKRVLPRAARCCEYLFDPHASDAPPKLVAVNSIAIPNEIFRCQVERKCFNDLLARPMGRWMFCNIEMDNLAPMIDKDHQNVQHLEAYRRHD